MKALVQHDTVCASGLKPEPFVPDPLLHQEPKAVVKQVSVPKVGKNEVLIKVAYVAQNPIGKPHVGLTVSSL